MNGRRVAVEVAKWLISISMLAAGAVAWKGLPFAFLMICAAVGIGSSFFVARDARKRGRP